MGRDIHVRTSAFIEILFKSPTMPPARCPCMLRFPYSFGLALNACGNDLLIDPAYSLAGL